LHRALPALDKGPFSIEKSFGLATRRRDAAILQSDKKDSA
jgi:hypothetical protein